MHKRHRQTAQVLGLGLVLLLSRDAIPAQQIAGSLGGQVTNQKGAVVRSARLVLIRKNGAENRAVTNTQGIYSLEGLAPGSYTLRLAVPGFAPYENDQVNVQAGRHKTLDITLQATKQQ